MRDTLCLMRVAYICEPQVGGTFVFFTQLRPLLARHGIDFRCIPPVDQAAYRTSRYWGQDGVDFLDLSDDPATALGQIIQHLEKQDFRAVLTLPGCHLLGTCLPAYLPAPIGCAAKIPHNGRGTYLPTQEMAPYIDWIAPVNHLLADDLIGAYKVPSAKVRVIYIGIDPDHFQYGERSTETGRTCQLITVGRLEDLQKNIFSLPAIVAEALKQGVKVHATVVGHGPDADELKARIHAQGLDDCFTLTGALPYDQIPALLRQSDIFLMPTRFEGCPHALLEGMATGCAPVVSNLRGTLDRIVEDGKSGFLVPLGDHEAFGAAIAGLARDPTLRNRIGAEARRTVLEKFTVADMAAAYADVLKKAAAAPSQTPAPRSLRDYTAPQSAGTTWRSHIPMPVKKLVRTIYARMGKSI